MLTRLNLILNRQGLLLPCCTRSHGTESNLAHVSGRTLNHCSRMWKRRASWCYLSEIWECRNTKSKWNLSTSWELCHFVVTLMAFYCSSSLLPPFRQCCGRLQTNEVIHFKMQTCSVGVKGNTLDPCLLVLTLFHCWAMADYCKSGLFNLPYLLHKENLWIDLAFCSACPAVLQKSEISDFPVVPQCIFYFFGMYLSRCCRMADQLNSVKCIFYTSHRGFLTSSGKEFHSSDSTNRKLQTSQMSGMQHCNPNQFALLSNRNSGITSVGTSVLNCCVTLDEVRISRNKSCIWLHFFPIWLPSCLNCSK